MSLLSLFIGLLSSSPSWTKLLTIHKQTNKQTDSTENNSTLVERVVMKFVLIVRESTA